MWINIGTRPPHCTLSTLAEMARALDYVTPYWLLTVCLSLWMEGVAAAPGTPLAFRGIFIGRCEDYKLGLVNKAADRQELSSKNCTELWTLFSRAWVGKPPCNVTAEDYEEFVDAAAITIPEDMSNFWDGWDIYDTVRTFSREGQRSWTLDYTLIGYLGNGFNFCGDEVDGINTEECPDDNTCGFGRGAVDAFWAEASTYFATYARGVAKVFFNSSRPGGAFQLEDSFFTEYELSNINSDQLTQMNIYLLTDVKQKQGEDCESESIDTLKSMLSEKNVAHQCWDNPSDVFHQLCIDYDDHKDCTFLSDDGALHKSSFVLISLAASVVIWLLDDSV